MPIKRHFLGWDKPVLNCAISFLLEEENFQPCDLSTCDLIAPTRHAGRRLREELARQADERDTGILVGRIIPPDLLCLDERRADTQELLVVWIETLLSIEVAEYRGLLPNSETKMEFNLSLSLAERIMALRKLLRAEGMTIADVVENFTANPEPERWDDLRRLEELYLKRLERRGWIDDCRSSLALAADPKIADHLERVCVLFTPDLSPLARRALQEIAKRIPVEICIHAPPEMADRFDSFGCPRPDKWRRARVEIADEQISCCDSMRELTRQTRSVLRSWLPDGQGAAAVGVPDSELLPSLRGVLESLDMPAFDPSGEPLAGHSIYQLLEQIDALFNSYSYADFALLVRHPHFLNYLVRQNRDFNCREFLSQLDNFHQHHLPNRFEDLRREDLHPLIDFAHGEVKELLNELDKQALEEALPLLLRTIYANATPADRNFSKVARQVVSTIANLNLLSPALAQIGKREKLRFFMHLLKSERLYSERSDQAIDLLGWAELHWENASNLILAGLHERVVPESVSGDMFLPNSARTELGLRDNDYLLSRDLYLFNALIQSHSKEDLVVFLSRTNQQGDPLKPSQILFQCDEETLLKRVRLLFQGESESGEASARPSASNWLLKPCSVEPPSRISVTAFKNYLECPFRFYLSQILRMEKLDARKLEMDARDFGIVCHTILERFATQSGLLRSSDPKEINQFLQSALDDLIATQYGSSLSVPLQVQIESLRRRLEFWAQAQAAETDAGWTIVEHELKLSNDQICSGLTISGKIDRIDQHADGRVRILDYKTSETARKPKESHLKNISENCPEYARLSDKKRWVDLQLPLYAMMLPDQYRSNNGLECGYFNLPKTRLGTAVEIWKEMDGKLESARRCAAGVAKQVRAGVFWPPEEKPKYENYGEILLPGWSDGVIDPENISGEAMEK